MAALITEPILQNIGIVEPEPRYLEGLRKLADRYGFILIFDEVKTGFRHGIGGYAKITGVTPDLVVFGKAMANGYPIAALGGKKKLMDCTLRQSWPDKVLLSASISWTTVRKIGTILPATTISSLTNNSGAH